MCDKEQDDAILPPNDFGIPDTELMDKIEKAYRIYKLSEVFLNDVADDYGKYKLARLRMEFARHQLITLIEEARAKGINIYGNEILRKYFYPE